MKFETLKKDNKKKIAIITIAVISITLVGVFAGSFAKYKLTQSISLANGTINYKAYDFKIMAMYQQKDESTCTEDNCYDAINTMPSSGYAINENKSYCTIDNKNKDEKAILKTIDGNHTFSNLSKQDKCYLYFDKSNNSGIGTGSNMSSMKTLAKLGVTVSEGTPDFSKVAGVAPSSSSPSWNYYSFTYAENYEYDETTKKYTLVNPSVCEFSKCYNELKGKYIVSYSGANSSNAATSTNLNTIYLVTKTTENLIYYYDLSTTDFSPSGIYKAEDNDGATYYYRGAVTNNYLKFANKWWRIIRINGDGSIRIIYDGTTYHANGTSTSDSIAVSSEAFSGQYYSYNTYVGFMQGATNFGTTYETAHSNSSKSNAMSKLETWYQTNLLAFESLIDINAGFCGDRSLAGGYGIKDEDTFYNPFQRLVVNKIPLLMCNKNDMYTTREAIKGNKAMTYPIGLISADDVALSGGVNSIENREYYLYNGNTYWTMTPSLVSDRSAYVMYISNSGSISYGRTSYGEGLRPVINLRADVQITGSGTQNDPFVVS